MASAIAPSEVVTRTAMVGLPRESSTSRAWTSATEGAVRSGMRLLRDPTLRRAFVRDEFRRLEEELHFAFRAFRAIGPVHEISAHLDREIATDGSGCCRNRIRRADGAAAQFHRVWPFDDHGNHRRARDILHQRLEERLADVFAIV